MKRHAPHAWAAIPCTLVSLVLAGPAAAADPNPARLTGPASIAGVPASMPAAAWAPRPAVAGVPALDHVIIVVMENHSYDEVRTLPYISTLIQAYTSCSQSYAVDHPSQPNYVALWAASTLGVTNDNCPPPGSPYSAPNLGFACETAGLSWKSYCENLPAVGSPDCASLDDLYRRKHHACPDFSNLTHSRECPYSQLAVDIAANALPALSFVVPNMCNDMHDCTTTVGDTWLANNLPAMISAVGPRGLVILTWDETGRSGKNHILTVFAGPTVKSNYVCSQAISHYTVVRTICDVLGLPSFANALSETTPTDVWALPVAGVEPHPLAGASLSQPTPNPFHTAVTATLGLPSVREVRAYVIDASGRKVRDLFAEQRFGTSEIRWDGARDDGRRAAPGLYFLYVRSGGDQLVRSVALTR